ncbi:SusC/RagA family TonB-linked outer membrane protein [Pedobacter rhodius]|uniref:SusC/RagA family TonB-linked outer membrane protein n=1 Tax=Pedobacter rhodius TaxID=3004098 RepID=A0ABT4KTA9_9SPHI|nr:SusC/RagA family TonB-linked outer membrane protein [Pedobacter sp. SJ11]MCZ4222169.1 SusC/RagA family TonB-linked outer membrane protein [Pedobacter sp. SJ11]
MSEKKLFKNLRLFFTFLTLLFLSAQGFANQATPPSIQDSSQLKSIKFIVLDENDIPVKGIRLNNLRVNISVQTDSLGMAQINGILNDEIRVSLNDVFLRKYVVGTNQSQIIRVDGKNPLIMKQKAVVLTNDILVSPNMTTGSTQAVYNNDLVKFPVTSVKNALIGRLAGLYTNQTSGRPGADEVNVSLRGQNPIVLVDGIPRDLTRIDLEEIESVTVLKDAVSTAMLGMRSSGGVLAITTKKGVAGMQQITLTAQGGIQSNIKTPKVLDAYNYSLLYNEARVNSGDLPVYTQADLDAYRTGSDPIGHPNVNWQDQVLKNKSWFNRYDLNFRGGGTVARYYVGLEYQNQKGQFVESDMNAYSTNNNFSNYTVRSNVDINLTPKTTLGLHLFGRIINSSQPGANADNIFTSILNTPNNAYPVYNENGSYGGTTQFQNNIYAQTVNSGYRLNYRRDIITDLTLRRSLDEVTPGLWAQALVSFYSGLSENTDRSKSFAVYKQTGSGSTATYQLYGTNGTQANSTGTEYQNRQSYLEGAIGYKRSFGLHNIDAQIRATSDNVNSGSELGLNYYGGSGRASYNFDERYTAEIAFGLNRTNRYPKGSPMGFFPAAGLSWDITKEKFMPKLSWLNDLKLFTSYGRTGNDAAGYFVFQQFYVGSPSSYFFGTSASSSAALRQDVLANPNVTWEKSDKFNIGLKTNLFKNHLFIQAEYFNNKYSDLLTSANLSSIVGTTVRNLNIGINRYTGYELQLNFQQSLGKFSYFVSGNASTLQSKVIFQNEIFREYSYQSRTGLPVGQPFGYIADGLFQSQAEINSSAKIAGYAPVPGDIKYKDLNSDGIIDQFDQTKLGTSKPLVYYGATLGFAFSGFDFSVLLQGVANRNLLLTGNSEWEFQNGGFGQAYEHHLDRWTPATAATATYPRLTVGNNFNNDIVSSFWMHSGNYLRLKNVELGYTIASSFTRKIKVSSIRLFVNGTNLLTSSSFDRVDPETYGGVYPIQRVVNGGLSVKF